MEERCWEVCKLWWGSYVVPFNCCGRSCHCHHRWCWATLGRSLRLGQTWKGTHTLLWEWGLWVCNSKKGKSYVVLNWMIFCSFQMPNKEISKVQISFTFHLLSATKLIISDCPINSYFEGLKIECKTLYACSKFSVSFFKTGLHWKYILLSRFIMLVLLFASPDNIVQIGIINPCWCAGCLIFFIYFFFCIFL